MIRHLFLFRFPVNRALILGALLAFVFWLVNPFTNQAVVNLGQQVSEKLIARAGVAVTNVLIKRSADLTVVGMAPTVSTTAQTATGVWAGTTHATLNGSVNSMLGQPSATVYFQWGNSPALGNTTTPQAITTTGAYSANITGFNDTDKIYYRIVVDGDGTHYGATTFFVIAAGSGGYLLRNILLVVLAAGVLIAVLLIGLRGGFVALLIAALIGVIGFYVVATVLGLL